MEIGENLKILDLSILNKYSLPLAVRNYSLWKEEGIFVTKECGRTLRQKKALKICVRIKLT
jgi:hypothetical protein